jgi:DNA replication protein DnaC
VLSDEASRRDSLATANRAQRARLDPAHRIENWDDTANVTFDKSLLNELVSLRFLQAHQNLVIVGPVGTGKTFIAHALAHIACRHAYSALASRAERMLKTLKHARLDTYEAELRRLITVDLS